MREKEEPTVYTEDLLCAGAVLDPFIQSQSCFLEAVQ